MDKRASTVTDERATRRLLAQVTGASWLGTFLDFYDWAFTGTVAALVWPAVFFPASSPATGLLLALSTYAVGLASRPFGSILFGHFADRLGRKDVLVWTLFTVFIASIGLGLVPGYTSIGLMGGVLVILFRILQGLGIGGEWGSAISWVRESAANGKWKGFWVGITNAGFSSGQVAANVSFLILLTAMGKQFFVWGWRIPFFIGAAMVLLGLVVRYRFQDSPVFKAIIAKKATDRIPSLTMFRKYWKRVLLLSGATMTTLAAAYLTEIFILGYFGMLRIGSGTSVEIVTVGGVCSVLGVIFGAMLLDVLGRRNVFIISTLSSIIFAAPFFIISNSASIALLILAQIPTGILMIGMSQAAFAGLLSEYFPTKYRASGAGFSLQLAGFFGGGIIPVISADFLSVYKAPAAAWPYIASTLLVSGIVSLACLLAARETRNIDITKENF